MFEHCSVIGLEENHTKTHRVQGINVVGEMLREGLEKTKGTERERPQSGWWHRAQTDLDRVTM